MQSLADSAFTVKTYYYDLYEMTQIMPQILLTSELLPDLVAFYIRENFAAINEDPELLPNMKSKDPNLFSRAVSSKCTRIDPFKDVVRNTTFIHSLIQLYFPYLPDTKPDEYACDEKVTLLFLQEYDRRSREMQTYELSQDLWHNILLGAVPPTEIPILALPCAFASGHLQRAIDIFPHLTIGLRCETFVLCAANGFTEGLNYFLTNDNSGLTVRRGLKEAATNGNTSCVKEILQTFGKTLAFKNSVSDALLTATEKGHCKAACAFLESDVEVVDAAQIESILRRRIDDEHYNITTSLLNASKKRANFNTLLRELVKYCIDTKKPVALRAILEQFHQDLNTFNFQSAFTDFLADPSPTSLDIVQYILDFCGKNIPMTRLTALKEQALEKKEAEEKMNLSLVLQRQEFYYGQVGQTKICNRRLNYPIVPSTPKIQIIQSFITKLDACSAASPSGLASSIASTSAAAAAASPFDLSKLSLNDPHSQNE